MNALCNSCSSCGMPMKESKDFALGNMRSEYCSHCTDEKGTLLPYEKVLEMTVGYYMRSQGIDKTVAHKLAGDLLSTRPAWKK